MVSTMPEPSSPRTIGRGIPCQLPSAAWRQLWQTPLATMRTEPSPSRGGSTSSSSTRMGARCWNRTGAFIVLPGAGAPARPNGVSAPVSDPGLQVTVQQVDQEVHDHEEHRDEEDGALRHR